MSQRLLFPDPRPLVERLGPDFFRSAPRKPGVYLMQDNAGVTLYVGKAKDLRKRLCSYRVANPDTMRLRQLRLLRSVVSIEVRECPDEFAAVKLESHLIRTLRPRFNRAGTRAGTTHYLNWRIGAEALWLVISRAALRHSHAEGPFGREATFVHASLARLLWCCARIGRTPSGLPRGWIHGNIDSSVLIELQTGAAKGLIAEQAHELMNSLFRSEPERFLAGVVGWLPFTHPVDRQLRDADFELISRTAAKWKPRNVKQIVTSEIPLDLPRTPRNFSGC